MTREEVAALMDAGAAAMGLVIPDCDRDAVIDNLAAILAQTAAFPATAPEEPGEVAPVFRP